MKGNIMKREIILLFILLTVTIITGCIKKAEIQTNNNIDNTPATQNEIPQQTPAEQSPSDITNSIQTVDNTQSDLNVSDVDAELNQLNHDLANW
jgi:peptidoglycan hydrolase CwlO-like protein